MEEKEEGKKEEGNKRRNISYTISSCQHTENIRPIQQALNECLMNELNLNKHSPFNYCYFPPGKWKNQWKLKEIF